MKQSVCDMFIAHLAAQSTAEGGLIKCSYFLFLFKNIFNDSDL